ncbi:MAG TPA: NUDIX domain-containing protein [Candidatus Paceibacterota bacterium]
MVEKRSIIPGIRFFVEEGTNLKPGKLDDAAYSLAQSAFPVLSIDILLYNKQQKRVYLATRKIRPMEGEWWFVGGRIRFGQTEEVGLQSVFKRETGHNLDTSRLEFFGFLRSFMKNREQEPYDVGSDSLAMNFALEVTPEEIETIGTRLDEKEYKAGQGFKAFTLEELEGEVQPIVLEMAQWALRRRK